MTKAELLAKLNSVAKPADSWLAEAKQRVENQNWLQHSQMIALKILRTLRAQGKSQKDLAFALGVKPQQVNKWVKGKENLTLETIAKIESALDTFLIGVPTDEAFSHTGTLISNQFDLRYTPRLNVHNYKKAKKGKVINFQLKSSDKIRTEHTKYA